MPRTIRRQLLLVTLLALIVTIASIRNMPPWGDEGEAGNDLETLAHHVKTIALLLDNAAPANREQMLQSARHAGLDLVLMPLARQQELSLPAGPESLVRAGLGLLFPLNGTAPIKGWTTYLDGKRVMAFPVDGQTMLVAQGMTDNIITDEVLGDASLYLTAYIILVVFFFAFAVRAITEPLKRIAEAANSSDVAKSTQIFEERGSVEIVSLARALNGMSNRIRLMVDTRTRMLRGISHDLRTPLTRLRLRADTMRHEPGQGSTLRDDMLSDIDRIDSLLSESLTYLRDDYATEDIVRTDVASILQTVCSDFSDVGFNVYYSGPNRLIANCRPLSITRAVTNLCDNAMKFAGEACVELADLGLDLSISVIDNGPGVPEHLRERLFEPFFKGDAARAEGKAGFGLGLSIVADIVEAHRGEIELLACQPQGLIARIILPKGVLPKSARSRP
jgi:signal transduction histidine kinase